MEAQLRTFTVADNATNGEKINTNPMVIQVTTSESSVITLKTSLDDGTYSTNANFSETVNGTAEFNITDVVPGQYIKVVATSGTLTAAKILG